MSRNRKASHWIAATIFSVASGKEQKRMQLRRSDQAAADKARGERALAVGLENAQLDALPEVARRRNDSAPPSR